MKHDDLHEKDVAISVTSVSHNTFISQTGRIIAVGAIVGFTMIGPALSSFADTTVAGKEVAQISLMQQVNGDMQVQGDTCYFINIGCIMCDAGDFDFCICNAPNSIFNACVFGGQTKE